MGPTTFVIIGVGQGWPAIATFAGVRLIMIRKLKRPNGELIEEYITGSSHFFYNGDLTHRNHDSTDGEYTGRFLWRNPNGKMTRWYTARTAPKWLLNLYNEATI